MPGEIRNALSRFKDAHAKMTATIVAELEKATAACPTVEKEGIEAARLPAAMLASTRGEIRDMTAEFATQTNGGPHDPLEQGESAKQSANSDTHTDSAEKKTLGQ